MRLVPVAALATLAIASLPSSASARPVTIGATVGSFHTRQDADAHVGGSETLGVFGRLGLTPRLGAQLEAQRVDQASNVNVRRIAALAVLDLGRPTSRLAPILLAGIGLDSASTDYMQQEGQYAEAGLGLEYRVDGGLVISADFRVGARAETQQGQEVYNDVGMPYYAASPLFSDGGYRSVRVGAGMRF